jgi:hypothetical protein
MTEETFEPLEALRVLSAHGVRYVLIGGFAAVIRGSPVITGDLDLCNARDDENIERLARALQDLQTTLRDAPPDVPVVLDAKTLRNGDHFTFTTRAGPLDCLGTPAGTAGFEDLDADATEENLDGLTVRVASLDDLIRMKRAAGRAKDLIALEWLGNIREELEQNER